MNYPCVGVAYERQVDADLAADSERASGQYAEIYVCIENHWHVRRGDEVWGKVPTSVKVSYALTPSCGCGHPKGVHLGRADDCQMDGCPCPLYWLPAGVEDVTQ